MKKIVYIAMSADIIHHGHLNIISKARELGDLIIGLHTDKVIAEYWRLPVMPFEQRKEILENIIGVTKVIPQDEFDQVRNLNFIKPDFVVHGDDWITGDQIKYRKNVINALKEWNGQLIEIPYSRGYSITELDHAINSIGTTPQIRIKKLRRLLQLKNIVRILEAHNGLTGLIVEKTKVQKEEKLEEFDGIWISSLCDSTAKGKPDIELVDFTSRLNTINDILEVTTKPIILDGDTGGQIEHFVFIIKSLERLGVSAIIIEDKIGLKKNSLFGTEVLQTQDSIEHFSLKISTGKSAQVTKDFMIIARIESLILKAGVDDALLRAEAYIDAGADGIMIHSSEKSPDEIFEFCRNYKLFKKIVPLVVVPSSYDSTYEHELIKEGVNIVIYANHLIRSAYPAMVNAAKEILINNRSLEIRDNMMSIKEILELIPGGA